MPRVQRFYYLTVLGTVIQIVPYNKQRTGILIKNYAGGIVWIANDQTDIQNMGFPLTVGDYIAFLTTDGDVPELQLYAVASAQTDVRVVETYGEIPPPTPPAV
jgi:hypothetical protein